jgi:5-methylthioadenosine/S-adenosylhomocysteine deaminase
MTNSIIIKGGIVLSMLGANDIQVNDIWIEDDRIVKIGRYAGGDDATVVNATGCVVMPGLINTHTHTPMTIMRSTADNLGSPGKGRPPIFPAGQDWTNNLTPDDHYWSSFLAIAEMVHSGTTTFVDMYHDMDKVAQAVIDSGIRGALGWEIMTFRVDPILWLPYDEGNARKSFDDSAHFAAEWDGRGNGRVITLIAPHESGTCHEPWLSRSAKLAGELKRPITIHVSEGEWEVDFCMEKYGLRPVEVIQKAGIFEHLVIGAHTIHVTSSDIKILMEAPRFSAAACLGSYLKLADTPTPIIDLLTAGINVSIGTDGAQTNNNLNMWEEIHLNATLPGFLARDSGVLDCFQVLKMATQGGARALGLEAELGTLEVGKKADVIVIDTNKPHMVPLEGALIGNLAHSIYGSEVRDMIVDGKIIMRGGKIQHFDEAEVLHQAQKCVHRLREQVGLPERYTRP